MTVIIFQHNIGRPSYLSTPRKTIVEWTVGNRAWEIQSILKTDCSFGSVYLRTVEHLYAVQNCLTISVNEFLGGFIIFHGITCDHLATPRVNVFSRDLDVSRQNKDLSSDINSVVGGSSWLLSSPMIVFHLSLKRDCSCLNIVSRHKHVLTFSGWVRCV